MTHFLMALFVFAVPEVRGALEVSAVEVSEPMKKYLLRDDRGFENNDGTLGVVSDYEVHSSPTTEWFLLNRATNSVVLLSNLKKPHLTQALRATNTYCFVENLDNLSAFLDYLQQSSTFGHLKFIICTPLESMEWLESACEYLWSRKVMDFLLVFQLDERVEVVSYNPFNNTILNFTTVDIYPDKMADMNGWTLHVAVYPDAPRNTLRNGILKGKDVNLIKDISKKLNATLNLVVVTNFTEIRTALETSEADFSFTQHLDTEKDPFVIDPSYPLQVDTVNLVVPTAKPKPQFQYLFLVFKKTVWAAIWGSFLVMIFVNYFFTRTTNFRHRSFSDALTMVGQILLNYPYDSLSTATTPFKVLLLSWIIFSFLVSIGFNTALRSSIVKTKYGSDIKTAEELLESKLGVAINMEQMGHLLVDFLEFNSTLVPSTSVMEELLKYDKECAFIVQKSYAKPLTDKVDGDHRLIYKILPESLSAGQLVYNFPLRSPYKDKVEELLRLFGQYNIGAFGIDRDKVKFFYYGEALPLSMGHLQTAFYIILLGFTFCLSGFILEHVYYRRRQIVPCCFRELVQVSPEVDETEERGRLGATVPSTAVSSFYSSSPTSEIITTTIN